MHLKKSYSSPLVTILKQTLIYAYIQKLQKQKNKPNKQTNKTKPNKETPQNHKNEKQNKKPQESGNKTKDVAIADTMK